MKFKNPLSRLTRPEQFFWYSTIVVICIVACYNIFFSHSLERMVMTDAELRGDTASYSRPIHEDSVQLANIKVPLSVYQSDYSAESWYADYKANKVAFDKKYDEGIIDIHGVIDKINNDSGCAEIVMRGSGEVFEYINFSNCPADKDGWSDEVAKTAVGQEVHIRGIYSGLLSSSYEMSLYKCHIINDN